MAIAATAPWDRQRPDVLLGSLTGPRSDTGGCPIARVPGLDPHYWGALGVAAVYRIRRLNPTGPSMGWSCNRRLS